MSILREDFFRAKTYEEFLERKYEFVTIKPDEEVMRHFFELQDTKKDWPEIDFYDEPPI